MRDLEIREYASYREEEILGLYAAVGWTAYTRDMAALREGFARSLLVLGAYEGDELLGILRAVGDGTTVVLIQDLLVSPEHQRRGVGTALLRNALDRYGNVRQIQLVTDDRPETAAFYRAAGLRPLSEYGCLGYMK